MSKNKKEEILKHNKKIKFRLVNLLKKVKDEHNVAAGEDYQNAIASLYELFKIAMKEKYKDE